MKFNLTLLLFVSSGLMAQPQQREQNPDVRWASRVIEFSSELSSYAYSAESVLGRPDVLPNPGDNPNAWLPVDPDTKEYIVVQFDDPIHIRQIAIAESYNPSAVSEIYAYDTRNREYLIGEFPARTLPIPGRMLTVFLPDSTDYKVSRIKVVIDGAAVEGYAGIDAIGVSRLVTPLEAEILVVQNLVSPETLEKLDTTVNSPYRETRPVISPDGNTLFFSRAFHPQNTGGEEDPSDIWISSFNITDSSWSTAVNAGESLNNRGENYISSVTPDGNSMMVVLGNRYTRNKTKPGISFSRKTENGWTEPMEIEIENDYIESTDGDYFMANNRKMLIMAIDRFDSYGGKDLYISFEQRDGKWSEPRNLGPDINTPMDEVSPFLAPDDETLYFSSLGYSGFGGQDVYIARRLDNTWKRWTEPENMGAEVNSAADEISFNIPPSGTYAYFARGTGEDADILRMDIPVFQQPAPVVAISGKVINTKTQEPVEARIVYDILPEGKEVGIAYSDPETGEYEILLPYGTKYAYLAEAEGFYGINDMINLSERGDYNEIENNLMMTPLEKGETIELNNIYFATASTEFTEDSYDELNRLAEILIDNPMIKIEVAGHSDNVGQAASNLRLSQDRAQAVVDYLVSQGVSPTRTIAKGYGEDKPLASNDRAENRALNRRVEFIILDE